mgnify:CR=1 FL=1
MKVDDIVMQIQKMTWHLPFDWPFILISTQSFSSFWELFCVIFKKFTHCMFYVMLAAFDVVVAVLVCYVPSVHAVCVVEPVLST